MTPPSVSVVMPVRDAEGFLVEAVESILKQEFSDFELIAIDDGSEDGSREILRRYVAADRRVRVFFQERSGIVDALNRGILEARAKLIARMDADDVSLPHRLDRQLAVLAANPAVAAVGSGYEVINAKGAVLRTEILSTDAAEIRDELQKRNCIAHPTVVMRREAVLAVGGYRHAFRHCEDWDLWLRLSERHDLVNLPVVLLRFREHSGQSTWLELEQRLLAELGALVSARHRRAGQSDPASGIDRVTRDILRRMDVGDSDIAEYLCRRALDASEEALRAGNRRAARAAIALASAQRPMPWRTRCRCWVQAARTWR